MWFSYAVTPAEQESKKLLKPVAQYHQAGHKAIRLNRGSRGLESKIRRQQGTRGLRTGGKGRTSGERHNW